MEDQGCSFQALENEDTLQSVPLPHVKVLKEIMSGGLPNFIENSVCGGGGGGGALCTYLYQ